MRESEEREVVGGWGSTAPLFEENRGGKIEAANLAGLCYFLAKKVYTRSSCRPATILLWFTEFGAHKIPIPINVTYVYGHI
jgi:hypothetical protein